MPRQVQHFIGVIAKINHIAFVQKARRGRPAQNIGFRIVPRMRQRIDQQLINRRIARIKKGL